jgi:hypothetical protein
MPGRDEKKDIEHMEKCLELDEYYKQKNRHDFKGKENTEALKELVLC